MRRQLFLCPLLFAATAVALSGACSSASDCHLNGDCVADVCKCDAAWSSSPDCSTMSFAKVQKVAGKAPGYYNATESSWGGFPIQANGTWNLIHAQMKNHCPLGSWTTNSIVARSVSTTGKPEGPYAFAEELLPPFAHNPTIRQAEDGTYVIFFIGGWRTNASQCGHAEVAADEAATASSANNCTTGAKYDPATSIRVGGDYKTVPLPATATIADCAASCCSDPKCEAFSFNNMTTASITCKHKDNSNKLLRGQCPCCAKGATIPGCSSGTLSRLAPPPVCAGTNWPKSCGPHMPGDAGQNDCCGSAENNNNAGCGITTAHSKSLSGPWEVRALNIVDQWLSDDVYCTHTNPTIQILKNGTWIMAFNAGYCNKHLETIGTAISHGGWEGPWHLLSRNSVLKNPDGTPHKCEGT